jgi:glycosyltransferase involved in cell wall biosynthesis
MGVVGSGVLLKDEARSGSEYGAAVAMTAAIYIHDLSPGGVERQSLVLAKELQARGVDITLVVHQMRGELMPLVPKGLPMVSLNGRRTLDDVLLLRRFLRDERPAVLMANVDHNNIAAAMASAIAGTGTKLVICQHNPLTAGYHATVNWKHRLVPLCYRALASQIDHAVAVSNGIAEELVAHAGLPREKISTINNAVIGPDFADRAGQPVDHPWLMAKDRPVFVSAGRLVEMKDHKTLLRAFALHVARHPAKLIILGTGPMHDELQALAGSLGIADHVDLAGFARNPLPFMRAADAFVLSSRSEGFGNVLVEAMGCGTPVVSTDCPHGPSDILDNGRYGILVPPRDPSALAPAFEQVLAQRERLSPTVLRDRADSFSYASCADGYWRLLRRIL